ncbi:1708_t:CDS:2 [Ambispora leptoticha]|uniref:1708_t:CDS:1 n=1 Tax=Ambispora leptoticha TaxID=144679 RepID=A0A9N9I335_9GLOM|nr:1708_t:CDS:2 [Ambispora leptoticha]
MSLKTDTATPKTINNTGEERGLSSNLYEDKFFIVTSTHLIIKKFYFPLGTSKSIPLTEITSVVTDEECPLRWWQLKSWGMPLNNVWFALDFRRDIKWIRGNKITCIVTVRHDSIKKGFSFESRRGVDILRNAINQTSL